MKRFYSDRPQAEHPVVRRPILTDQDGDRLKPDANYKSAVATTLGDVIFVLEQSFTTAEGARHIIASAIEVLQDAIRKLETATDRNP